jgi:hypothetical protein
MDRARRINKSPFGWLLADTHDLETTLAVPPFALISASKLTSAGLDTLFAPQEKSLTDKAFTCERLVKSAPRRSDKLPTFRVVARRHTPNTKHQKTTRLTNLDHPNRQSHSDPPA